MLQIFIGFIFIYFHFTINGFDLLADFIGYFLVYMGMSKFPDVKNYATAKPVAIGLAVLNFVSSIGGSILPEVVVISLTYISIILNLYLVYLTIQGIVELERYKRAYLKSDKLLPLWRLMLVFTIGGNVLGLLSGEIFTVMSAMFGVAAMVTNVIFLFYLISVKEGLDQAAEE